MNDLKLFEAIQKLARIVQPLSNADMGLPWVWRAHEEGLRMALLGSYHELCDLAVLLATERAESVRPLTKVQRALAPYHVAYRDLQAILLGVTDEEYEQVPTPGEWSLRNLVGHIVGTERYFFSLIHYGVQRQREEGTGPPRFPNEEVDNLLGSSDEFEQLRSHKSMAEVQTYHDALHQRALDEFATISDEELEGPSLWWEGKKVSIQYRIHRLDAHLRQHTVQAQKTVIMLDRHPTEAQHLLRLLYHGLAEVERPIIGAQELGRTKRSQLATLIAARAEEVANVIAHRG